MKKLPKVYNPSDYEQDIYDRWEASGFFHPDTCIEKKITKADAPIFSIILPPPNVTGTLHIGHAAMLAIEDVMVRYHRMKGDRTLWVPGTDHAAIATQEKVERLLWNEEKKTRHDFGRDRFLEKVEAFAQNSHDHIVMQTKRMGSSLDWSREYYSLDDERSLSVRTAFKQMYDAGLIYRGDRIVNWDPKMQSNVSDIEVVRKEEKAPFYYFQYGPFVIGTARPETKFGDKYVVMHPDDKRYKKYTHGDTFTCEWINGQVTAIIIKDEAVDMNFGTGVMTITPWHDATDFFMAERHGLEKEQVIDFDGKLLSIANEFVGLPILDARPKIVKKLKEKGLLVKIDTDYVHSIATNSRGGGLIEPQIMKQWWVNVHKEFQMPYSEIDGIKTGDTVSLKKLLQHVVRLKQITILPKRFEKNYFQWVDHFLDWCLSRQLWYGHRVPAWYKGEEVFVGIESPKGEGWNQDPDTLDTWFSAGIFTFSSLGWPNKNAKDLHMYHPTSVLETGYDILTFWVVRMILMSTYLLGQIPFKTVYLHGLVRDEQGRKMSKSLNNTIDPLDVSDTFGTDAVRLSLIIGATPGNDSRLSEEKIGGFRNFSNKLWNIARFMLMQIEKEGADMKMDSIPPKGKTLADRWILSLLDTVVSDVTHLFDQFQFSQAGEQLRDYTWNELADWYLEIVKIENGKAKIVQYILNTILKLWHPFMPFVTEAIWSMIYGQRSIDMLMVQQWPHVTVSTIDTSASIDQFYLLKEIITTIRIFRAKKNIKPNTKSSVTIVCSEEQQLLNEQAHIIRKLARVELLTITSDAQNEPSQSVRIVVGTITIIIYLVGSIDIVAEQGRLQKEINYVAPYVESLKKKLGNASFVDNAPKSVIIGEKAKLVEAEEKLVVLRREWESL